MLSGKYRPSETGEHGSGRLQTVSHPAFAKFSERNFSIVAEVERVAKEIGRSMSQVSLNWVANRPGVGVVLVGATKQAQLDDNLQALDFVIPAELVARLDAVSAVPPPFPYNYFLPDTQIQLAGSHPVGDKPASYAPPILIQADSAASDE